MDYYQIAWFVYLFATMAVSVVVFLLIRPLPLLLKSASQAGVFACCFMPSLLLSEMHGYVFTPLLSQIVVELLAGKFEPLSLLLHFTLLLLAWLILFILIYKLLLRLDLAPGDEG